ncbi:DUF3325 domain-containing protein [Pseudomonas sp. GD04087]|uniref:DUF3325 domain-containing protein n=1 Tax=unclassified Pseudomonas TaxID=196821 RepID=UPI00244BC1DF|nr:MULTISPECIES: DUF3325 domain-containing protein [unclassified Pseudomonas]MDH0292675.1 DUF3325 domain-containing protein [Pseudomonas sp. GD04087]MDH1048027.1 DUF3325 domain-containing protein [Pseudomonas sp. GD03903]MDH2002191.1 DUF3325 domain-containing protein [Pseudomonas sp. GD03691]
MLLVFGLNLLALAAACLSLSRHHRDLFGSAPSAFRVRLLRIVALVDGALALAYAIHVIGVELGIVYWACLLMIACAMLVLLLAWRPRWALPTAAAMPVIGGVLAVLG